MDNDIYKSRLRPKGQVTVPLAVREILGAEVGDDLLFSTDESGRVMISLAQIIDPEQAWFWSERWQRMEREAQEDIDSGRISEYETIQDAIEALDQFEADNDAEG